ncbi:glycosyltransferase family 4 protein [bacterium]|nr:glycosyltransferase family 4 protein [bacterium]
MKILVTMPYPMWPVDFGGAARTYNIALSLAHLGYQVILLAPAPVPEQFSGQIEWRSYQNKGTRGHFYNPSFTAQLKAILKTSVDLIVMSFPYQSFMVMPIAKKNNIPVVYDAHNVEKDRFLDMGSKFKSTLVGFSENYLCRNASTILAVSDEDATVFRSRYSQPVVLLPNGVDVESFRYMPPDSTLVDKYHLSGKKVVLYFGALNYLPNIEALKYLVEKIWPEVNKEVDDAVLLIVGKQPPKWLTSTENIIVTGIVEDIMKHINLADIVAVPLFSGGGSRLKIIESLACGKTVLSTEFGAAGLTNKQGEGLKLSKQSSFAQNLINLLHEQRRDENKDSRAIAMNFSWHSLVEQIDWENFRVS